MADIDKKISELTELTIPVADDVFPVVDITAPTETKKVTFGNVEGNIDHTAITNVGTNSHINIDNHISNNSIHGTMFAPASSTNNAIVSFSGTTGSVVQNTDLAYVDNKLYQNGYTSSYLKFNNGIIEIWAGGVKQAAWS